MHEILMTNPIAGQYMLYVAQLAYTAHATICRMIRYHANIYGLLWVYLHLY